MGSQSKYYHFVSVEQFGDSPRNKNLQKKRRKEEKIGLNSADGSAVS